MDEKKTVPVYLTGNGGRSAHDMTIEDSNELEKILDMGSNKKTFKFHDGLTNSKVTIVLDKLFIVEVEEEI